MKALSILGVLTLSMMATVSAQEPSRVPATATEAATRVRTLFFQTDYEGAVFEGNELIKRFPASPRLRAWTVAAMSRNAGTMVDQALSAADSVARRWPASAWTQFARAMALHVVGPKERQEAIKIAERARTLAPAVTDMLWLRGYILMQSGRYADAIKAIDGSKGATLDPEIAVIKANVLLIQGFGEKGDTLKFNQGLALFEQIRKQHPNNVNAHVLPAGMLSNARRATESFPLYERAAQLAPLAAHLHAQYWQAIQEQLRDRTTAEKNALILADLERLLQARPDYPSNLLNARYAYTMTERMDRWRELEERILRQFPGSVQAERVTVFRYGAVIDSISKKLVADPVDALRRHRRMMWDYVNTGKHANVLSGAYLSLFHAIRADTTVAPADLLRVVQGMAKYNRINPHTTHVLGPIVLADRKMFLAEAERIAKDGFTVVNDMYADQRATASAAEYADEVDRLNSLVHDALGWVYFQQDRLSEAEKELQNAESLDKKNPMAVYHRGRIAEARGRLAEAERFYTIGRGLEIRGDKPSHEALRRLYIERNGSTDGLDGYLAKLEEAERARRQKAVLDSRIAQPEAMLPFKLKSLDGGEIASESLLGKIVVINFWGTWCGPCVKELPDLQKFYQKYKSDPAVVFLTIDNDQDIEMLRKWLVERKFDIPVLLDDGYVTRARIYSWPTTWFVGPTGKIEFIDRGASDVIYEEFIWRVESMKAAMKPVS